MKLSYRSPHDKNISKTYGLWASHGTVCEAPARGSGPPVGTEKEIPLRPVLAFLWHCMRNSDAPVWASNSTVCEVPARVLETPIITVWEL